MRGVCSFSALLTGMFSAVNIASINLTLLLITQHHEQVPVVLSSLCKWVRNEKKNSTMIKAMYFRFIVLLIVAQTRVYTNTDHFLSNFFLLSFIYCKRAGWKYSPLMAKWERGSKVREQGQQVVWLKGYTSTRRMGQDSCTK